MVGLVPSTSRGSQQYRALTVPELTQLKCLMPRTWWLPPQESSSYLNPVFAFDAYDLQLSLVNALPFLTLLILSIIPKREISRSNFQSALLVQAILDRFFQTSCLATLHYCSSYCFAKLFKRVISDAVFSSLFFAPSRSTHPALLMFLTRKLHNSFTSSSPTLACASR
jgi:hypothetical protein